MSKSSEQSKTNGLNDQMSSLSSLEAEISQIAARLSQGGEENADSNLREMFEQLSKADGVAKDMEDKLDDLLGNLDNLLASLEGKGDAEGASTDDKETHTTSTESKRHTD